MFHLHFGNFFPGTNEYGEAKTSRKVQPECFDFQSSIHPPIMWKRPNFIGNAAQKGLLNLQEFDGCPRVNPFKIGEFLIMTLLRFSRVKIYTHELSQTTAGYYVCAEINIQIMYVLTGLDALSQASHTCK